MPIVAFDSKQFLRGRIERIPKGSDSVLQYHGFHSQLGIGVEFDDDKLFLQRYMVRNAELQKSFKMDAQLLFYSSTYLKQSLGMDKAIAFADQLITDIQETIKRIHFSYVILPPSTTPSVSIGGFRCPQKQISTRQFIDNLGPMFSYLTAYSFLWKEGFRVDNRDFHIDAFRSKETMA